MKLENMKGMPLCQAVVWPGGGETKFMTLYTQEDCLLRNQTVCSEL